MLSCAKKGVQMKTDTKYQRLIAKSVWQGECLICTSTPSQRYAKVTGYGYAHRYVWEQNNGPIPSGLLVCHTCDTPRCVNINHLFLGSAKDNTTDMTNKGRRNDIKGPKKLRLEDWPLVVSMRYQGKSYLRIGLHFKVDEETVSKFLKWCPHD